MYSNQYPGQQYSQQYSNASLSQYPQQSQFISSSYPTYDSAQTQSQQSAAPSPSAYQNHQQPYQSQYQQQSQHAQAPQHLQTSHSQLNSAHALSTQVAAPSAGSLMPHPSAALANQQTGASLFGGDYVTGNGDIIYIRQRPVKPQKEDGLVKSPIANGGFHDAFKLDWDSGSVIIKDLPSKEAKCSVRKRTMGLHTWGIYKDGSADRHNLLGLVRKASSTKADITLEKTPQNSFTAEGNLADMTYIIKKGDQPAAQVSRNDMARRATGSRHSYALQVMPGNDCMLMMAISVCVEGLSQPSFGATREDQIQ